MRLVGTLVSIAAITLAACSGNSVVADQSPTKADLGQIVASGKISPVGRITPAGQPDAAAFEVLAESGYAAVIDLRTGGEDRGLDEKAVVEGLGMNYVSLPINRDGISFDNAKTLDGLIQSIDGPVLVHCGSSNRVGALLALRASMQGADDEAALEIGKKAGLTGLEPAVRQALGEKHVGD